ncbi:MAG: co-chaperone GroES [Deltaproteobacteria bacterium]|nr:co-chaperone GroES [Deltaproteobacteria bacterium]MBW2253100.1 co-chaperone GroES [Deltaproteobacteria bacterium]
MHLRPLFDRIVVERIENASKSKGGLFLPESAADKPTEGVVLAVGTGRISDDGEIRPLVVKEGDRVLFGKYSGTEIKIDGHERLVLREDEIYGVIDQ